MPDPERLKIWMYHRVLPRRPTAFGHPGCYHLRGTAITPEQWADDLRQLQPVVSLAAVVDALEAGRPSPAGHVLTFDDGYGEWSELVARSLRAAGATATFFVTTGMHRDAPRAHAIDAYYWLLDHAAVPVWSLPLPDGEAVHGDLRSEDGKRWLVIDSPLKRVIRDGDAGTQAEVLERLQRAVGVALRERLSAELYMDEGEWRALAREHAVGGHGVTHRPLTLLADHELATELVQGRAMLRGVTGTAIDLFSYPDGACDARVTVAVQAAGYRGAVLAGEGPEGERYRLPRVFRCAGY